MHLSVPRALGCLAVLVALQLNIVEAQTCPGGAPQLSNSYSSYRVGNANNTYTLSQFDPTLGTLYSVQLKSVLYFTFSYTLTNVSSLPEDYIVSVFRDDSVYVHTPSHPAPLALEEDMGNTSFYKQIKYTLPVGVKPGVTDTTVKIMYPRTLTTTFNQSIVPFLGSDSLYITYKTVTTAQAGGSISNSNVSISNKLPKDSIVLM